MNRWLGVAAGLLLAQVASAHEIHHAIETTSAVAVHLTYADGKPFAFEAYEAYPDGKDIPAQVGRTDEQGRALFVPGEVKKWHFKAFSADGHGVDIQFDAPSMAMTASGIASGEGPNRASLLLFGLSVLLSVFGIYQLWLRRKP